MIKSVLPSITLMLFITSSFAQKSDDYWIPVDQHTKQEKKLRIKANDYDLYHLQVDKLAEDLKRCVTRDHLKSRDQMLQFSIPVPGKKIQNFRFFETPIMEEGLQAKYPNIRTYTGQGVEDPRQLIKVDIGPGGFHGMIFSNEETYLIEPAFEGDRSQYMVFDKYKVSRDHDHDHFVCHVTDEPIKLEKPTPDLTKSYDPTGEQLRTYRLALATTGEYSNYHGGTRELVLAAMVTAMNRVNGVYERDLTITMVLVNNTDTLIYFDPATDPYTNFSGSTMLDENVTVIESIIGPENYDIGHVFSTGGGGIAGLGVVCRGNKAYGVTGQANPIGDPFSIDYVAHEIGHQFGGTHTFNSCGGQGSSPYEPGSGVTIMAYAGICNNTNLQSNSIDQFHVASYDEMITYSQQDGGNTCPVITDTGNTPPIVNVGEGGFYIPYQTPFELEGTASDIDGDSLTYCWEQFDTGPNTHPNDAAGTAPLFRTFKPVNEGIRIFPRIEDLVNNRQVIGELLPQFGREMNFRMTVRDNAPEGGGVDYASISFNVADNAGPFKVIEPNGGNTWNSGELKTISWDVANTDQLPVNCSTVDILLSSDGGFTYPDTLAAGVVNDGFEIIKVPNLEGEQFRVKVKSSDNVFFDISDQNVRILPSTEPDYVFATNTSIQFICDEEVAEFEIQVDTILGFNDTIRLAINDNPLGTEVVFSENNFVGPATVQINITKTDLAVAGDYTLTLTVSSGMISKEIPLDLILRDGAPAKTLLFAPSNGVTGYLSDAAFNWDPVPFADSYIIEFALSPDFSDPVLTVADLTDPVYKPDTELNNNTIYFWRVRSVNNYCGQGDWSDVFSFQTELSACERYSSNVLPADIPSPGSLPEIFQVTDDFVIEDVNVRDLTAQHRRIGQLLFRLHHPSGESAKLIEGICGNSDDINITLDDEAATDVIPCPPTDGLKYRPLDSLSRFNGLNASGLWILEVQDSIAPSRGELTGVTLELCGPSPSTTPPTLDLMEGLVEFDSTVVITTEFISGQCGNVDTIAEYIITSLPAKGNVLLDDQLLQVGSVFSQEDIDNGLLSYHHNGEDLDPDQFKFILNCNGGVYLGEQEYDIIVFIQTNTIELFDNQILIVPNPSTNSFTIRLNKIPDEETVINILNTMGQIVMSKSCKSLHTNFASNHLPEGVYFCQVSQKGVILAKEKVLIVR